MTAGTKFIVFFLLLLFVGLTGISIWLHASPATPVNPLGHVLPTPTPKPLLKYTFQNLKNSPPGQARLTLDSVTDETKAVRTGIFSYTTEGKHMTGQFNLPTTATPSGGFPVLVMLRGFVDPDAYQTGMGTKNAAAFFAAHGFATLSPDFLGFGGSDPPAVNTIAARLEKPKNVLDLLSSLPSLPVINPRLLGLWAHSNGGQIALSVLEITGQPIPTALWAPVSKSFPYSVLYYTDESEDQGKALRHVVADFEEDYDVFDYSIDRYWGLITAPMEIHQGTADDAVPLIWSQDLVKNINKTNQDIELFVYPGADHNLRPAWDQVVARDLTFFQKHLK